MLPLSLNGPNKCLKTSDNENIFHEHLAVHKTPLYL